jgi:hypothetical protein
MPNGRRHRWTPAQLETLRELYPEYSGAAVARVLQMTEPQVYNMAKKLGIGKSDAYLNDPVRSGRLDGKRGADQRFRKGMRPWNKGTHFSAGGRSVETRFKPGRAPEDARNYLPIGSLRITKDGLLERKVTDDQSLVPARRWEGVHRLVWAEANGPVPRGHAVAFKPGMHTTDVDLITLDRLELVSRAELMRRNSYHTRYPKEIGLAIQARGALMRKINRLEKKQ